MDPDNKLDCTSHATIRTNDSLTSEKHLTSNTFKKLAQHPALCTSSVSRSEVAT